MTNCIKSEFYRIFHKKSVWRMTGACLAAVLLVNAALWGMNLLEGKMGGDFPWATTRFAFSLLEGYMNIPLFLSAVMGGLITGDELKHRTVNNSVAFGLSRDKIYLSRIPAGLAASAFCLLVTEAGYIGSGYLLLEDSGAEYTLSLLKGTAACVPAWIAGMTAVMSLYYLTGSRSAGIWSWLLIMVAVPAAVGLLGLKFAFCERLSSWLLYTMVSYCALDGDRLLYNWSTGAGVLKCMTAGFIGILVFMALGIVAIRRREL